jgi:hypothetical protein
VFGYPKNPRISVLGILASRRSIIRFDDTYPSLRRAGRTPLQEKAPAPSAFGHITRFDDSYRRSAQRQLEAALRENYWLDTSIPRNYDESPGSHKP